jgi:tRNA (guanine-N7-)-methyltransferase
LFKHSDCRLVQWAADRPEDFLEPSGGWLETRYGAKSRREGRRPYYLRYRRA